MNEQDILKPSPDITENYIRFRMKDPKLFKKGTFRTVTISAKKGIKAIMGKLKKSSAEKEGSMVVQSYLFEKDKWTVARARAWIKEHKKDVETMEEKSEDILKGWLSERFEDAPPNWMLYLSPPYAENIWGRTSHVMVKSVKLKKHTEELLWLCSDRVYGIYIIDDEPRELGLSQFKEYEWLHHISDDERQRWWPKAETLYVYYIWSYIRFKEPLKYRKPRGFQMFKKGSPKFIADKDNPVIQVKLNTEEDITLKASEDLLYEHALIHEVWGAMEIGVEILDVLGKSLSQEDIRGYHERIGDELISKGYSHLENSDLTKEVEDNDDENEENKKTDENRDCDIILYEKKENSKKEGK